MKLTTILFLPFFVLAFHFSFGQTSKSVAITDSTFTLLKYLLKDKFEIGQHGVFFNEKEKQAFIDFRTIQNLSLLDFTKYQRQIIQQDEHIIKVWKAKKLLKMS